MKFMKYVFITVFLFSCLIGHTRPIPNNITKNTLEFARKDTSVLKMDVYRLNATEGEIQPVMIFIFGGAFKMGQRDLDRYNDYFITLAEDNITVVSIDYRLGLIDKKVTAFNTKAVDIAINMAVEDLFSATNFLLQNQYELDIDPQFIMVSGSSAGAITALQADYILKNGMPLSEMLPPDFNYAGIISFAGGIFSHKGNPKYKQRPSPTLFFHGDRDKIVTYKKLSLFGRGMFGSKKIAKRFKREGYAYYFMTFEDRGHAIAEVPMQEHRDIVLWFIDHYVCQKKDWRMDNIFKDRNAPVDKKTSVFNLY